jgi:hypothetical protein
MPLYSYECEHGESFERRYSMGAAPSKIFLGKQFPHACCFNRVFGDFNFVEDRTRMFRNPRTGTRFSDTLGCEMPEDRASRDALYASKGIEPVSPRDMPSQWKVAKEYADHLKSGGEKLDRKEEAKLIEPPDLSDVKSIAQQLRESQYRAPA